MTGISILHTGGTLGMVRSKSGLTTDPGFLKQYCMQNFEALSDCNWYDFDPLIDSSQLNFDQLNQLILKVKHTLDHADAVVIFHGTDTMAYTSTLLALLFTEQTISDRKRIIITGAMKSVVEDDSDAYNNIDHALKQAEDAPDGVWLCFNQKRFNGAHVTKFDSHQANAFDAPFYESDQTGAGIHQPAIKALKDGILHSKKIELIHCLPGVHYRCSDQDTDAIILRSYGSGNLPLSKDMTDLLNFAQQHRIPVINISQCWRSRVEMARYAAGSSLNKFGIISSGTMTLEAVYMKLLLCLHLRMAVESAFAQNWCGELPATD